MDCRGSRKGLEASINVTPLVDVVLVLLIILMVVVPLALDGYDLVIPRAAVEPAPAGAEPLVLAIDAKDCAVTSPLGADGLPATCRVRLGGEQVAVGELRARVAGALAGRAPSERVLLLSADERMNYEAVLRVVDEAGSGLTFQHSAPLRFGVVLGDVGM